MTSNLWDIFICHASEDKADIVRPLTNLLTERGIRVWVDESEIHLGDSLQQKINEGLAHAKFGVVVLSPSFFSKPWTQVELGALFNRHVAESKVILPVWHRVSADDVRRDAPLLADVRAVSTDSGLAAVAQVIYQAIMRAGPRYRPGAPIFAGRLTKQALLALPVGSYLLSNCYVNEHEPRVSQFTPPPTEREAFWRQLREHGLANTRFYAFADITEFRAHIAARGIWSVEDE